MNRLFRYFLPKEWLLLGNSFILITTTFFVFDHENYLTLAASMIGVLSLILAAKGKPAAQILMLIFSILYGIISYSFQYYGEMLTYLGMTAPMAVITFISWIRHPFQGNHAEVQTRRLSHADLILLPSLCLIVTVFFYYVLELFGTANLIPSTLSVTTSFTAVYLSFQRSPYFALAYAANDIILVVLWIMASLSDTSYVSVAVCFLMFLVNDLYGFVNWLKMQHRQENS